MNRFGFMRRWRRGMCSCVMPKGRRSRNRAIGMKSRALGRRRSCAGRGGKWRNRTGGEMALEDLVGTTKYISNLNPAWPIDDDFLDEGDNHVRGIKNVLKNTFPNLNAPVTVTAAQLNLTAALPPTPTGYIAFVKTTVTGSHAVPAGARLAKVTLKAGGGSGGAS